MGAQTRQVGGGQATPVANNFNNWLNSQLMGTPMPGPAQQPTAQGAMDAFNAGGGRFGGGMQAIQQYQQGLQAGTPQQGMQQQPQPGMAPGQGFDPRAAEADPQGFAQWNRDRTAFNAQQQGGMNGGAQPGGGMVTDYANPMQTGGGTPGNANPMQGEINRQQSNSMQPQQQQVGFQQAFNGALNGRVNDASGAQGAIQQFFQNPTNQFSNQFTAPQFQGANLSQLPTNFGAGQSGMADMSGFGQAQQSGFNTQQNIGNAGNSQFDSMLMNMIQQSGGGMQGGGGQSGFNAAQLGGAPQLQGGMSFGQAFDTLGQDPMLERNRMRAVADQRARFGAEGAGSLGTGAQFAEGNLNAELLAQDASQRRGQAMQLMGQDLQERMGGANVSLQGRGQDMQTALGNMQGGIQGAQNMNQFNLGAMNNQTANMGNALSAAGQGRGQDFSTQLGMRGQNLSQQGMGLEQSMFNAGQGNQMQGNMINAALQNQGMGNQFALGAQGLNNNAQQQNNANNMGMAGMQNDFNMNNAGNNAQFGNAAQQGNANFLQNMLSQGMGMNQMGNNNMMQAMQNLFGGFQQSNSLGTPQAQNFMQPSNAQQFGSMLLNGAGMYFGRPPSMPQGNQMLPNLGNAPRPGITPGGAQPMPQYSMPVMR